MKLYIILLLTHLLVACAGVQTSQQSLTETQSIIEAATILLNKTTTPYTEHVAEADRLRQQVQAIYTREQTRSMNQATVSMWKEVINGEGNLFALLDLWKSSGTLSPAMREESVKKIQRLLNSIYDLEKHKGN